MNNKSATSVLFLTLFLDLLGYGLIIPLLPDYGRTLGATATLIGIVAASYSFAQFIVSPLLGSLSDKTGRRPVLLLTIAISAGSYILFGFVNSLAVLLISRMLSGAASVNLAVAQAYITDITPPDKRTKALGLIGAALGLGFIFGPPIGGIIKEHLGINWVGFIAAMLSGLNLVLALLLFPETRKDNTQSRRIKFLDFDAISKVKSSSQLSRLFVGYFLFMLGFIFLTVTGVLMWKDKFALMDAQVGYTFATIGIITAVIQGMIGKLSVRFTEKKLSVFGLALMALSITAMPFANADAFLRAEIPLIVVFALGYALVLSTGTALVTQFIAQKDSGVILGQYQSTAALARIIGPVAAATLYGIHPPVPFVAGGAILFISLLFTTQVKQP